AAASAQPPPVARQAEPPPEKNPEPTKRQTEVKNDPDPDPVPSRRKPVVSTTPTVRKSSSKTTNKTQSTAEDREQQLADSRRQAAAELVKSAKNLREGLSSGTDVLMPGEGVGEAYASYASAVRSIYEAAWIPPDDTANDNAITKVTVTIEYTG